MFLGCAMDEELQSVEELKASLAEYKEQLRDVQAGLQVRGQFCSCDWANGLESLSLTYLLLVLR